MKIAEKKSSNSATTKKEKELKTVIFELVCAES